MSERRARRTGEVFLVVAMVAAMCFGLGVPAAHAANTMPAAVRDFLGMGTATPSIVTGTPPDTTGAVGSNYYVEAVNGGIEVFHKDGTVAVAAKSLQSLWTGYTGTNTGNGCSTHNDGDPIVRYDAMADRWVVQQFSLPHSTTTGGPSFECVAVSKTNDPTGAYWLYDFKYPYAINDYGKLGVWPDAYYATFNMFDGASGTYKGPQVCAWDRVKMLAGQPATQQCVQLSTTYFSLLAANADGAVPPPAGSPEYFVAEDYGNTSTSTGIDVWKFHVDWTTPGNSALTGPTLVSAPGYTDVCTSTPNCIPQPGSAVTLDSLGDRMMDRLVYRNFGSHESLVVSHTVADSSRSGIGWWELRLPGGTPTLYQNGVYNVADTNWRFMPSLAMDQAGDIVLGFSLSASSGGVAHPAIGWVGRLASDPLGTMGLTEQIIDVGSANAADAYSGANRARWGDYSTMTIDPTDDCTFWYGNELYNTAGVNTWDTRIAEAKLPSCGANDFSIGTTDSSVTIPRGGHTAESVNTGLVTGSAESVALSVSGLPAGATASFNASPVTAGGSSTLTISSTTAVPAGDYPLQLVGAATSATHATTLTLHVLTDSVPTCTDQPSLTTAVNTALPVSLGCADSDGDTVPTYTIGTAPAHGHLGGTPDSSGHVMYTPDSGYVGNDSFTFTGTDSNGYASAPATVDIAVGPDTTPVCDPVSRTIGINQAAPIPLHCTDADTGQTLTLAAVTSPSHGNLGSVDSAAQTVTYTPNSGYTGSDSFTYDADDGYGGTSTTATVTLTVVAAPTVVFTMPTTATGVVKATFNRDVTGVSSENFVLKLAGTVPKIAGHTACFTVANAATPCSGTSVRSAVFTPSAALSPGQSYDATVNPGAVAMVDDAYGNPVATTTTRSRITFADDSLGTYGWQSVPTASTAAYGSSYSEEHLPGASASYRFTGTAVTWYTVTAPSMGKASVYVDGVLKATVGNYATATHYRVPRTVTGLSSATHVLKIVVLGQKGATAGTGTFVAVDAVKVGSTLTVNPAFTYTWQSVAATPAYGGRYERTDRPGSVVSLTFYGTGVDWITLTGPYEGKANVYVDGKLRASFDNYAPAYHYQVLRAVTGLANGAHTLRIATRSDRNAASKGTFVISDGWRLL